MRGYQEFKKIIYSLFNYRLRSLLSTLGILFGVAALIAMLSIGEGAKQETIEQIEQLGINSIVIRQISMTESQKENAFRKLSEGLNEKDVEAFEKNIPWLKLAVPLKTVEASISASFNEMIPEILAVTHHYQHLKELRLGEGRFICELDKQTKRQVCVLGYEIAKKLGQKGHLGNTLRMHQLDFEIVGILKPTYWKPAKNLAIATRNLDETIFIPLGLAKNLESSQTNLSEIIVQVQQLSQMENTVNLIKHLLYRSHKGYEDYQLIIPQELFQQANRTQKTFNWILGSITAISLLVGGIGIMNIMLATVSERTKEIGIRRALGASQKHILQQFLLETLTLTLIGAFLGIVVGVLLSILISYVAGWKTIVTFWSVFLSLIMSIIVGLCSGLYPALQAAKMNPIQAIRHL